MTPNVASVMAATTLTRNPSCWDWNCPYCYTSAIHTPGKISIGGTWNLPVDSSNSVRLYPNPVLRNAGCILELPDDAGSEITVEVSNIGGTVVYRRTVTGVKPGMEVSIETSGWTAGSYVIRYRDGKWSDAIRVIVVD
jgi:hypothetical protein